MSQLKVEINDTASIIKFAIIFNNLKNLFDETNNFESGLYFNVWMDQICCCELCLTHLGLQLISKEILLVLI